MNRFQSLTKSEIQETIKKGERIFSPFFSLSYIKNGSVKPKFAFLVSKKDIKKAVNRNRAKRILREITRKALFPSGFYAFFIKESVLKGDYLEKTQICQKVFDKIK